MQKWMLKLGVFRPIINNFGAKMDVSRPKIDIFKPKMDILDSKMYLLNPKI